MFVPFFTKRSNKKKLYRRKGGGGKGGGGGGGGGGRGGSRSSSVSSGGGSKSARPFGNGGGTPSTIPSGQLFAGRSIGGGTRSQVYGDKSYGSGYPNTAGRGVAGRGFPFVFWPIAWAGAGVGGGAYLYNHEYGRFDNSSRTGGILMTAAFQSSSQNTTFRLLSDNSTVVSLIQDILEACSNGTNNPGSIVPTNYNDSLTSPKPEQTVQYYRASTVALTLDGYNNTGAFGPEGTPDTPLPSNIDSNLLNCLNNTIGEAVPLVDAANLRWSVPSSTGLVVISYLLWCLSGSI